MCKNNRDIDELLDHTYWKHSRRSMKYQNHYAYRDIESRMKNWVKTQLGIGLVMAMMLLVLSSLAQHWFGVIIALVALVFAGVRFIRWRIPKFVSCSYVLYMIVVLLLIVVRFLVLNPSTAYSTFPTQCTKPDACSRLAPTNLNEVDGLTLPEYDVDADILSNAVSDWMPGKTIIENDDGYFLSAPTTVFWGFTDNVAVQVVAISSNMTQVWIQAEARLGTNDFGSNYKRVESLVDYLQATV